MFTQGEEIGQVAVMGQGDAAGLEVGEHGLDIAQEAAPRGGVTGMADGHLAGQSVHEVGAGEGVAHMAHMFFIVEPLAVEGGDAAGLLAAVLQGVQAQGGDGAGLIHAEHAEHATFEARSVVVGVAPGDRRGLGGRLGQRDFSTTSSSPFLAA